MGIEFDKALEASSRAFWEGPAEPYVNENNVADHYGIADAAEGYLNDLPLSGVLAFLHEASEEGRDTNVDLSSDGRPETIGASIRDLAYLVLKANLKLYPDIWEEDEKRFQALEDFEFKRRQGN